MFSAVVWSFLICEQMYFIIGLIVKRSIPTLNYYGRPKVLPFSIVQLYNCMPSNFVFTPLPHNSHQRPPHFLSPHKTLWPRFAATIFLSLVCAECILYSLYNSSISLLATLWEGQIMITGQFCSLSMFLVFVAHFTFPCPLSSHLASNLLGGGWGLDSANL